MGIRLTPLGRALYGLAAVANLWMLANAFVRQAWIPFVLSTLLAGLFGIPALRGRDPLARARRPPRWLGEPDPPLAPEPSKSDP
jgi:hypothetical protein